MQRTSFSFLPADVIHKQHTEGESSWPQEASELGTWDISARIATARLAVSSQEPEEILGTASTRPQGRNGR
jgi:hypothetical protein